MVSAVNYFLKEPLKRRNLPLWKFRVSQLLHERTNGKFDALYTSWRRKVAPPAPLEAGTFLAAEEVEAVGAALKRDGCTILPKRLSDADIAEITAFAFRTKAYVRNGRRADH
jgi:hypothetical protein